jgi:hypothetical protein
MILNASDDVRFPAADFALTGGGRKAENCDAVHFTRKGVGQKLVLFDAPGGSGRRSPVEPQDIP